MLIELDNAAPTNGKVTLVVTAEMFEWLIQAAVPQLQIMIEDERSEGFANPIQTGRNIQALTSLVNKLENFPPPESFPLGISIDLTTN